MKKLLSIILAILMIVTTIPMAFAADDYAVVDTEAGTVTIDGTLGGKTTATEEDLNAMVEILKNCVESGITTVIVTGSQPAKLLKDGFLTPLTSLAFEQLTYVYQDEKTDSYWGTVDLIYQDVTEIVEWEFYVCDVLKSITLPKVTTVGGYAFWALYYLETLTFGSVVTDISYQSFEVFYDLGYEIGGCNLVLNCGQLDAEFDYQPNLEDNTWWSHGSTGEWKSITLTHNGGEATCVAKAVCETCGEEYGEFDANKHTLVQKDAKAPTCTEIGWDAYEYCTACDYTTYVELPALTHTDANCDYKCDYNCGYEYETLDFSDAKVLTTVDGVLYIDGVEAETNSSKSQSRIYEGKYILEGDIETSRYIWIFGDTYLDLNGYTWNLTDKYINVNAPLSVYDTSEAETGKITSGSSNLTININNVAAGFNLYGGTIENTSSSGRCVLDVSWADVNLYAGKIKSNSQAISFVLGQEITLNIDGTVLESGDGYADVLVALGINDIAKGDIDVTDYKGDSLTAKVNVISTLGKITVFKGIKNTQEAEKYQIIDVVCDEYYDLFWEKTEYDENTGEKSIYTANNAFTQQPSAENGYTVDFNNSDATFQWYEVEETVLTPDNVTSIDGDFENDKWSYGGWYAEFFTVDVKAGDMITASTTSARSFDLIVYTEDYSINEHVRTTGKASVTIDSDAEVIVGIDVDNVGPTEFEFELIKISEMDETETDKTLQNPECGKTYVCKTSVGENVYLSDVVTGGHNIVSVDAKAPTCTEIGWDAYEYCTACTYTTYVELPADPDAHTDADGDYICDHGCGAEVVTLGGNVYPVDGDITNTGIHIGAFAAFDNCYKAGDGYMLIKGEGNNDTVMTLYNATIDVRGTGHKDAIKVDGEDIEIRFFGENNIFADEEAYTTAIGSNRHSQTFIGADDAVLNLYGNVAVSDINIESGTVNVYGADVNDIESVYVEGYLVISEGAVLNIISGDNGQGFNCGIIAQKEIVAEGEFNAIALTGVETDNEIIYNLTAIGNAVLGADTYSPYYGMEIPEDMNVEVNFIVPEGASVTVPEGITLNLDSMTNVDIDGELIVYGTLICTHTGGENTCDAPAVCDICGTEYGNIDADNHKDTLVQVDAKAPTCTEIGWDAYEYCTACTYTTYVEKEALKHSFTKYEVTEEAKCGVEGKEVAYCDNGCGATDEKAIAALTHKDADGDYKCDNGCGHEFEKPAPEEPTPDTPDEPTDNCDHLCHKGGFMGFIWKIVKFFSKLFKINPVCECGAAHY